ncbi:cytochrome c biogenesis protein ResB [bacterium]|nr:cytochrome c biogenesis protein ResB [bacterium]MBU1983772.1 cytochrome c biogenesis protein ResB [bacterium]
MRILDRIWQFFASVRLTIVLLLLLAVAMGYGTWIENTHSNGAARILVYNAWWFDSLIGLLALNLIGCTLRRAPFKPHQAGWIVTHIALLLIMTGAVVTHRAGIQGRLVIPEGETVSVFYEEELDRESLETISGRPLQLPFELHLTSFDQLYYPGSGQTRMFRSRVEVRDSLRGEVFLHDIVLNHPLVYDDFKISQSSFFELPNGRTATVLGVSYDPGILLLYTGGGLLVLGMIGIFFVKPYLKRRFPAKLAGMRTAPADVADAHKSADKSTKALPV